MSIYFWITPHDPRTYDASRLTTAERHAERALQASLDGRMFHWLEALGADDLPTDPTPIQAAAAWAETPAGCQALTQVPGVIYAALGWDVLKISADGRQCRVSGLPMTLEIVGIGRGSGPTDHGVVLVSWLRWESATLVVHFIPVEPELEFAIEYFEGERYRL